MQALTESEFCRRDRRVTRWIRSGGQNGSRPVAHFWRCSSCGIERVALANVSDAEGLARSIVSERRRGVRPSLRSGRTLDGAAEDESVFARLDFDDANGSVVEAIYSAYVDWDPEKNPSFLSWATFKGRCALSDWYRETLGRDTPKALTWAYSSDVPIVEDFDDVNSPPSASRDTDIRVESDAGFAEGSLMHALVLVEDEETSETLRDVALPIALGYSHAEVAELHGQSEAWVSARLRKLRARGDLRVPA